MKQRFYKLDDVFIMTDPESDRVCISVKDEWVEVCDPLAREMIRFEAKEVSCKEAMAGFNLQ